MRNVKQCHMAAHHVAYMKAAPVCSGGGWPAWQCGRPIGVAVCCMYHERSYICGFTSCGSGSSVLCLTLLLVLSGDCLRCGCNGGHWCWGSKAMSSIVSISVASV